MKRNFTLSPSGPKRFISSLHTVKYQCTVFHGGRSRGNCRHEDPVRTTLEKGVDHLSLIMPKGPTGWPRTSSGLGKHQLQLSPLLVGQVHG